MGSISDFIMSQLGGSLLSNLSGKLDSDENTTKDAISMALPMLLKGLSNNSSDQDNAQDLFNAVQKDHDGSIMDNLAGFVSGGDFSSGSGILKHIFGSKQENVVEQLSQKSGLDPGATGNLLAALAPVVMGFLGKTQKEKNFDVMGLVNLLSNDNKETQNSSNFNIGSLFRILDGDKDGNPLNDIVDAGKGLVKNIFKKKDGGKKIQNQKPAKNAAPSKAKSAAKAKVTVKPKAKTAAKAKAKTTAKPKAKVTVKPKAKTAAKAKVKTTAKPKAKTTVKSKAKTTAKAKAKTTAKPKAKTTAKPKAKSTSAKAKTVKSKAIPKKKK